MKDTALELDEVLDVLRRFKAERAYEYGVARLGVFGSMARGAAREDSDVDIVVEMNPNLYKRAALKEDLEAQLGRPVDVVRYRRDMKAYLRKQIDNEAVYV